MRYRTWFLLTLVLLAVPYAPMAAQQPKKQELGQDREFASRTFPALKLVRIPAQGKTFTMGAPRGTDGQLNDETPHAVTLTADFYLAATPVTRSQFAAFIADTGYVTDPEKGGLGYGWDNEKKNFVGGGKYSWRNPGYSQADDHPAVKTSWNDAVAFCRWLSKKDGRQYALPTEAQWEFACRAGSQTRFSCGDDAEEIAKYANVADAKFREVTGMDWGIAANDGYAFTSPVGRFRPNPFGLYDMHGNSMQWCADVFADFSAEAVTDPQGPAGSDRADRVLRGGCWRNEPRYGRSASRKRGEPYDAGETIGFRIAAPAQ